MALDPGPAATLPRLPNSATTKPKSSTSSTVRATLPSSTSSTSEENSSSALNTASTFALSGENQAHEPGAEVTSSLRDAGHVFAGRSDGAVLAWVARGSGVASSSHQEALLGWHTGAVQCLAYWRRSLGHRRPGGFLATGGLDGTVHIFDPVATEGDRIALDAAQEKVLLWLRGAAAEHYATAHRAAARQAPHVELPADEASPMSATKRTEGGRVREGVPVVRGVARRAALDIAVQRGGVPAGASHKRRHESSALLQTLSRHRGPVLDVQWTRGGLLLTSGGDGVVTVWANNRPGPEMVQAAVAAGLDGVDDMSEGGGGQDAASGRGANPPPTQGGAKGKPSGGNEDTSVADAMRAAGGSSSHASGHSSALLNSYATSRSSAHLCTAAFVPVQEFRLPSGTTATCMGVLSMDAGLIVLLGDSSGGVHRFLQGPAITKLHHPSASNGSPGNFMAESAVSTVSLQDGSTAADLLSSEAAARSSSSLSLTVRLPPWEHLLSKASKQHKGPSTGATPERESEAARILDIGRNWAGVDPLRPSAWWRKLHDLRVTQVVIMRETHRMVTLSVDHTFKITDFDLGTVVRTVTHPHFSASLPTTLSFAASQMKNSNSTRAASLAAAAHARMGLGGKSAAVAQEEDANDLQYSKARQALSTVESGKGGIGVSSSSTVSMYSFNMANTLSTNPTTHLGRSNSSQGVFVSATSASLLPPLSDFMPDIRAGNPITAGVAGDSSTLGARAKQSAAAGGFLVGRVWDAGYISQSPFSESADLFATTTRAASHGTGGAGGTGTAGSRLFGGQHASKADWQRTILQSLKLSGSMGVDFDASARSSAIQALDMYLPEYDDAAALRGDTLLGSVGSAMSAAGRTAGRNSAFSSGARAIRDRGAHLAMQTQGSNMISAVVNAAIASQTASAWRSSQGHAMGAGSALLGGEEARSGSSASQGRGSATSTISSSKQADMMSGFQDDSFRLVPAWIAARPRGLAAEGRGGMHASMSSQDDIAESSQTGKSVKSAHGAADESESGLHGATWVRVAASILGGQAGTALLADSSVPITENAFERYQSGTGVRPVEMHRDPRFSVFTSCVWDAQSRQLVLGDSLGRVFVWAVSGQGCLLEGALVPLDVSDQLEVLTASQAGSSKRSHGARWKSGSSRASTFHAAQTAAKNQRWWSSLDAIRRTREMPKQPPRPQKLPPKTPPAAPVTPGSKAQRQRTVHMPSSARATSHNPFGGLPTPSGGVTSLSAGLQTPASTTPAGSVFTFKAVDVPQSAFSFAADHMRLSSEDLFSSISPASSPGGGLLTPQGPQASIRSHSRASQALSWLSNADSLLGDEDESVLAGMAEEYSIEDLGHHAYGIDRVRAAVQRAQGSRGLGVADAAHQQAADSFSRISSGVVVPSDIMTRSVRSVRVGRLTSQGLAPSRSEPTLQRGAHTSSENSAPLLRPAVFFSPGMANSLDSASARSSSDASRDSGGGASLIPPTPSAAAQARRMANEHKALSPEYNDSAQQRKAHLSATQELHITRELRKLNSVSSAFGRTTVGAGKLRQISRQTNKLLGFAVERQNALHRPVKTSMPYTPPSHRGGHHSRSDGLGGDNDTVVTELSSDDEADDDQDTSAFNELSTDEFARLLGLPVGLPKWSPGALGRAALHIRAMVPCSAHLAPQLNGSSTPGDSDSDADDDGPSSRWTKLQAGEDDRPLKQTTHMLVCIGALLCRLTVRRQARTVSHREHAESIVYLASTSLVTQRDDNTRTAADEEDVTRENLDAQVAATKARQIAEQQRRKQALLQVLVSVSTDGCVSLWDSHSMRLWGRLIPPAPPLQPISSYQGGGLYGRTKAIRAWLQDLSVDNMNATSDFTTARSDGTNGSSNPPKTGAAALRHADDGAQSGFRHGPPLAATAQGPTQLSSAAGILAEIGAQPPSSMLLQASDARRRDSSRATSQRPLNVGGLATKGIPSAAADARSLFGLSPISQRAQAGHADASESKQNQVQGESSSPVSRQRHAVGLPVVLPDGESDDSTPRAELQLPNSAPASPKHRPLPGFGSDASEGSASLTHYPSHARSSSANVALPSEGEHPPTSKRSNTDRRKRASVTFSETPHIVRVALQESPDSRFLEDGITLYHSHTEPQLSSEGSNGELDGASQDQNAGNLSSVQSNEKRATRFCLKSAKAVQPAESDAPSGDMPPSPPRSKKKKLKMKLRNLDIQASGAVGAGGASTPGGGTTRASKSPGAHRSGSRHARTPTGKAPHTPSSGIFSDLMTPSNRTPQHTDKLRKMLQGDASKLATPKARSALFKSYATTRLTADEVVDSLIASSDVLNAVRVSSGVMNRQNEGESSHRIRHSHEIGGASAGVLSAATGTWDTNVTSRAALDNLPRPEGSLAIAAVISSGAPGLGDTQQHQLRAQHQTAAQKADGAVKSHTRTGAGAIVIAEHLLQSIHESSVPGRYVSDKYSGRSLAGSARREFEQSSELLRYLVSASAKHTKLTAQCTILFRSVWPKAKATLYRAVQLHPWQLGEAAFSDPIIARNSVLSTATGEALPIVCAVANTDDVYRAAIVCQPSRGEISCACIIPGETAVVAVGYTSGQILLWSLHQRRLVGVVSGIHEHSIVRMQLVTWSQRSVLFTFDERGVMHVWDTTYAPSVLLSHKSAIALGTFPVSNAAAAPSVPGSFQETAPVPKAKRKQQSLNTQQGPSENLPTDQTSVASLAMASRASAVASKAEVRASARPRLLYTVATAAYTPTADDVHMLHPKFSRSHIISRRGQGAATWFFGVDPARVARGEKGSSGASLFTRDSSTGTSQFSSSAGRVHGAQRLAPQAPPAHTRDKRTALGREAARRACLFVAGDDAVIRCITLDSFRVMHEIDVAGTLVALRFLAVQQEREKLTSSNAHAEAARVKDAAGEFKTHSLHEQDMYDGQLHVRPRVTIIAMCVLKHVLVAATSTGALLAWDVHDAALPHRPEPVLLRFSRHCLFPSGQPHMPEMIKVQARELGIPAFAARHVALVQCMTPLPNCTPPCLAVGGSNGVVVVLDGGVESATAHRVHSMQFQHAAQIDRAAYRTRNADNVRLNMGAPSAMKGDARVIGRFECLYVVAQRCEVTPRYDMVAMQIAMLHQAASNDNGSGHSKGLTDMLGSTIISSSVSSKDASGHSGANAPLSRSAASLAAAADAANLKSAPLRGAATIAMRRKYADARLAALLEEDEDLTHGTSKKRQHMAATSKTAAAALQSVERARAVLKSMDDSTDPTVGLTGAATSRTTTSRATHSSNSNALHLTGAEAEEANVLASIQRWQERAKRTSSMSISYIKGAEYESKVVRIPVPGAFPSMPAHLTLRPPPLSDAVTNSRQHIEKNSIAGQLAERDQRYGAGSKEEAAGSDSRATLERKTEHELVSPEEYAAAVVDNLVLSRASAAVGRSKQSSGSRGSNTSVRAVDVLARRAAASISASVKHGAHLLSSNLPLAPSEVPSHFVLALRDRHSREFAAEQRKLQHEESAKQTAEAARRILAARERSLSQRDLSTSDGGSDPGQVAQVDLDALTGEAQAAQAARQQRLWSQLSRPNMLVPVSFTSLLYDASSHSLAAGAEDGQLWLFVLPSSLLGHSSTSPPQQQPLEEVAPDVLQQQRKRRGKGKFNLAPLRAAGRRSTSEGQKGHITQPAARINSAAATPMSAASAVSTMRFAETPKQRLNPLSPAPQNMPGGASQGESARERRFTGIDDDDEGNMGAMGLAVASVASSTSALKAANSVHRPATSHGSATSGEFFKTAPLSQASAVKFKFAGDDAVEADSRERSASSGVKRIGTTPDHTHAEAAGAPNRADGSVHTPERTQSPGRPSLTRSSSSGAALKHGRLALGSRARRRSRAGSDESSNIGSSPQIRGLRRAVSMRNLALPADQLPVLGPHPHTPWQRHQDLQEYRAQRAAAKLSTSGTPHSTSSGTRTPMSSLVGAGAAKPPSTRRDSAGEVFRFDSAHPETPHSSSSHERGGDGGHRFRRSFPGLLSPGNGSTSQLPESFTPFQMDEESNFVDTDDEDVGVARASMLPTEYLQARRELAAQHAQAGDSTGVPQQPLAPHPALAALRSSQALGPAHSLASLAAMSGLSSTQASLIRSITRIPAEAGAGVARLGSDRRVQVLLAADEALRARRKQAIEGAPSGSLLGAAPADLSQVEPATSLTMQRPSSRAGTVSSQVREMQRSASSQRDSLSSGALRPEPIAARRPSLGAKAALSTQVEEITTSAFPQQSEHSRAAALAGQEDIVRQRKEVLGRPLRGPLKELLEEGLVAIQ